MKKRLCIIGLDRPVANEIKKDYFGPVIYHETLPKFLVEQGKLFVERSNGVGMLPVDIVVYYGIFEDDFPLLTALAIWGGDCFPNPMAMMDCRLKSPCLARALKYSRYNSPRGMVSSHTEVRVKADTVAKWGNWHCGENKAKFDDRWVSDEPAIIEPFFEGEAVRIVSIGEEHFQIKLEGADWLKSIHDSRADFMDVDSDLLEDTLKIKEGFGLEMLGNDYIFGRDGKHHLLEVNHIPNVTRFSLLTEVYIKEVKAWIAERIQ
ncbi:MAG: hypothetical protein AAFR36_18880 [Bacteroidota bacterium]